MINMKKFTTLIIGFIMQFPLSACSFITSTSTLEDSTPSITIPSEETTTTDDPKEDEYMNKTIELKIDKK